MEIDGKRMIHFEGRLSGYFQLVDKLDQIAEPIGPLNHQIPISLLESKLRCCKLYALQIPKLPQAG